MAIIGEDFPQTRDARKLKLHEIRAGGHISTAKVPGKGVKKVFRVPLPFLSYNPHNTRFLAQAKTLEKRFGCELSDENSNHVKEIEQFIWETRKDKNESTIDSLIKDGQIQPAVVTADGIILSGNRRFRLLNEISRNPDKYNRPGVNLEGLQFLEAVILDDEELTKKDIVRYESFYQYGTEDKVEYDPIQKYIAADDQKHLGFTDQEIANNFMSITEGKAKKVKMWLETFELMDEYLESIGEEGIYTALEAREEAFLNLRTQLNAFKNGRAGNSIWAYDDLDLSDLKRIFFDYIRNNTATHDFRIFRQVFSDKISWQNFKKEVLSVTDNSDLPSYEEYRKENEDLDESEASKKRGNDYRDKVGKQLNRLYGIENAKIINAKEQELPLDILKAISQKLVKLENDMSENTDKDAYDSEDFLEIVRDIQSRIGRIKQKVD